MPADVDEELAHLRKRAYGADADIHTDPEARARLDVLEAKHQRAVAAAEELAARVPPPLVDGVPEHVASPPPLPSPARVPAAGAAGGAGPEGASGDAEPAVQAPARSSRRRVILACVITAAVTAAIVVPATMWASSLSTAPFMVLHPIAGAGTDALYADTFRAGALRFEEFYGMDVTVGVLGNTDDRCLMIIPNPRDVNAGRTGACSPPGFDPQFDMRVGDYAAPEIIEQLGPQTVVRFQVVGDEVRVFIVQPDAAS